ncbi:MULTISPECIES: ABC transporter permease [unclassified Microbacterium]|uniref:ABC transporter permease n=1 Tax=unclassified Microbacterium TaxID=2609290 RepID=UPI001DC91170|nr:MULTISPECIES: ABC transporter permease [unclassified Microbacterium]CAH0123184.1 Daunorubicin/doxorubicin resistance ABC transporter permease protein DrrB [Microbacterium sp. Bi121]HWK78978.1 ABC transporter permease [Microbacterium sp.]
MLSGAAALLALLLLLWLRYSLIWLGIFLGLTFRTEGASTAIQVLVWPIAFASNAFVAPETMPAWLQPVADWNPISATATATRELFGNATGITAAWQVDASMWLAIAWPLVITLVFLPLSARAYRRLRH